MILLENWSNYKILCFDLTSTSSCNCMDKMFSVMEAVHNFEIVLLFVDSHFQRGKFHQESIGIARSDQTIARIDSSNNQTQSCPCRHNSFVIWRNCRPSIAIRNGPFGVVAVMSRSGDRIKRTRQVGWGADCTRPIYKHCIRCVSPALNFRKSV